MSESKTNWGKVLAIVAAVLGCVVISVCAAGSLLLGWCQSVMDPDPSASFEMSAHITMREFMWALERRDFDAARARGTDSFRADWPDERLDELASRITDRLGERSMATWGDVRLSEELDAEELEARNDLGFSYAARFAKGEAVIVFTMARQPEEAWLLDSFEIESGLLGD